MVGVSVIAEATLVVGVGGGGVTPPVLVGVDEGVLVNIRVGVANGVGGSGVSVGSGVRVRVGVGVGVGIRLETIEQPETIVAERMEK